MHSVLSTPQGGLPHSEIPRSKPVTGSFGLIAGYHVLHRLSTPRHPPCALRPVIIPTRHRRIGTSLSQACSCLTVRVHSNKVEVSSRTSHLRVHDLPSWLIQTFKPRGPKFHVGKEKSTGRSSRIMQLSKSGWLPFTRKQVATLPAEVRTKRRAEDFSRTRASVNVIGDLCTLFFAFFLDKFPDVRPESTPNSRTFWLLQREYKKRLGPRAEPPKVIVARRFTFRLDPHRKSRLNRQSRCLRRHQMEALGAHPAHHPQIRVPPRRPLHQPIA